MFIWAYVGNPKDGKFVSTSKMCIKFDDILFAESLRGDPPETIWIAMRTGVSHLVKATHREYLEHLKGNTPLLLAPMDQPRAEA